MIKASSRYLSILAVASLACNDTVFGLTSGPTMPEYTSFEPVDATDMVNLVTGDFTYAIPVMTVPGPGLGFPLVLSNHSGIMVKEEASWVGLGWNLQSGSINRQVNKLPDDFKGARIRETITSNKIYGWFASLDYGPVTVGVSWDNTNGYGGMVGYSYFAGLPKLPVGIGHGLTLGFNGVFEGATGPSVSVGIQHNLGKNFIASAGLSAGLSGNGPHAGASAGVSIVSDASLFKNQTTSTSLASAGISLASSGSISGNAGLGVSFSQENGVKGQLRSEQSGGGLPFFLPGVGFGSVSWGTWSYWIDGFDENLYFGFLYADKQGMACVGDEANANCSNWDSNIPWSHPTNPNAGAQLVKYFKKQEVVEAEKNFSSNARLMATAEDLYTVSAQGITGSFKPYRKEDGDYLNYLETTSKMVDVDCDGIGGLFETLASLGDVFDFDFCEVTANINRTKILEKDRNYLNTTEAGIYWRFLEDVGGAEYIDPSASRDVAATVSVQSKRIIPKFDFDRLVGFQIIKEDGVTYNFTMPVLNFFEFRRGAADDGNLQTKTTQEIRTPYAYSWLLKSILSPDYLPTALPHTCKTYDDGSSVCDPKQGDVGGWVLFRYGNGANEGSPRYHHWMSPFFREDLAETPLNLTDALRKRYSYTVNGVGEVERDRIPKSTSKGNSDGLKEFYYLHSVETPTHVAEFQTEDRLDGLGGTLENLRIPITAARLKAYPPIVLEEPAPTLLSSVHQCAGTINDPNKRWDIRRYLIKRRYRVDVDIAAGTPVRVLTSHRTYGYLPGQDPFVQGSQCEQMPGGPGNLVVNTGGGVSFNYKAARLYAWQQGATTLSGENVHDQWVQSDGVHNYVTFDLEDMAYKKDSRVVSGIGGNLEVFPETDTYPQFVTIMLDPSRFQPGESHSLRALKKIILKEKSSNKEVSAVSFDYDYSLAQNTPNSKGTASNGALTHGKLTLRSVKLGAGQNGPWTPPYYFRYAGEPTQGNPGMLFQPGTWVPYEKNYFDRWGYACSDCTTGHEPIEHEAAAWSLNEINLPSGGKIKIGYESDKFSWIGTWDETPGQNKQKFISPFTSENPPQVFVNSGTWADYDHYNGSCPDQSSQLLCKLNLFENARRIREDADDYTVKMKIRFSNLNGRKAVLGFPWDSDYLTCILSPAMYTVTAGGSLPSRIIPFSQNPDVPNNPNYTQIEFKIKNEAHCKEIDYGVFSLFNLQFYEPNKTATHMGVNSPPLEDIKWSVFANIKAEDVPFVGIGGGVRVKTLVLEDSFGPNGGVHNEVHYMYEDGVTPNLPPNLSDYVDGLYPAMKGYDFHAGNPGVMYGKVTTEFVGPNYKSVYHFLTAKDLPIEISMPVRGPNNQPLPNDADYAVTVKDFSALWGQLWKKEDFASGAVAPIRESFNQWAFNAAFSSTPSKTAGEGDEERIVLADYPKDGSDPHVFLSPTTLELRYPGASDGWRKYFGMHQNVSGLRYFAEDCHDYQSYATCAAQEPLSGQFVVQRFLPHQYKSEVKQEGLSTLAKTYYYDFMTGTPLKAMRINSDGAAQVRSSLPAYAFYDPMFKENQLTQTYLEASFHYPQGRSDAEMVLAENPANAVSATFTKWKPYFLSSYNMPNVGPVLADHQAFRVYETLRWNDFRGSYLVPNHACRTPRAQGVPLATDAYQCDEGDPNQWKRWESNGRNLAYDKMGHVTDFEDPHGQSRSQVFTWSASLPSAFATGAKSTDIFHETFESPSDLACRFPGWNCADAAQTSPYTNYALSSRLKKTGQQGIIVRNAGIGEVCMRLPKLAKGKTYVASAWYFDASGPGEGNGALGTRPGICIGNLSPECAGVNPPIPQSGFGSRTWQRIETEFTIPTQNTTIDMDNLSICLEASNGLVGADVLYDEVRLKPKGARMTSVAYNFLGLITSMADINEVTSHYEYDAFGNLMAIRNDDGILEGEQGKNYGKR